MAKLEILTYPNPILKKVSQSVKTVTPEIKQLAIDMLETMYEAPGVGLAAPQVGHNIRMVVLDTVARDRDGNIILEDMTELERSVSYPLVLINPVITKKDGKIVWEEGCLSVPTFLEEVERAALIEVEALDINGKPIHIEADGLLGVCIQHEIDHLDGKLFIERLSVIKMNRIKNKIRKEGYPSRDEEEEE